MSCWAWATVFTSVVSLLVISIAAFTPGWSVIVTGGADCCNRWSYGLLQKCNDTVCSNIGETFAESSVKLYAALVAMVISFIAELAGNIVCHLALLNKMYDKMKFSVLFQGFAGQTSLIGAVIYTVYIEQRKRTLLAITVLYGYSYFFAWIGAFCATLSAGSSYLIHIRGNV